MPDECCTEAAAGTSLSCNLDSQFGKKKIDCVRSTQLLRPGRLGASVGLHADPGGRVPGGAAGGTERTGPPAANDRYLTVIVMTSEMTGGLCGMW